MVIMPTTIRHMHRAVVDRLADTRWLRGRSGPDASWAHYAHHARAGRRAGERHAATSAAAHTGAQRLHARARQRPRAPRVLARWQTTIARLLGQSTVGSPETSASPEGQGR
jgi:hypothetical protein